MTISRNSLLTHYMLKILIADHYTIFRIGLTRLLLDTFPKVIIEETSDAVTLLNKSGGDNWDIIICGLSMENDNYFKLIRSLKQQAPAVSILICGVRAQENYIDLLLKAGVSAYIDKAARIVSIDRQIKEILSSKMQFH